MFKEYFCFVLKCLRVSFKSALRWADNPFGNLVSASISIILAKYLTPLVSSLFKEEDVQDLIALGIAVTIAILLFLLFRTVFVAPFQLYKKTTKQLERVEKQLDDFINGNEANLPFGDAIHLIKELKYSANCTDLEIQNKIIKGAFREKISAWGIEPLFGYNVPMGDQLIKIPHQFFYDVAGGPTSEGGYLLESFANLPGWTEHHYHKKYLNIHVNRGQIEAVFSNIKEGSPTACGGI